MFTQVFHIPDQPRNAGEGFTSRILAYGPGLLVMEWHFEKAGSVTPMHSHYHEQVTHVVKGSTKLSFPDGREDVLKAGESVYFAPNEEHALVTMEDDCVIIDAFTPIRIDHLERHRK